MPRRRRTQCGRGGWRRLTRLAPARPLARPFARRQAGLAADEREPPLHSGRLMEHEPSTLAFKRESIAYLFSGHLLIAKRRIWWRRSRPPYKYTALVPLAELSAAASRDGAGHLVLELQWPASGGPRVYIPDDDGGGPGDAPWITLLRERLHGRFSMQSGTGAPCALRLRRRRRTCRDSYRATIAGLAADAQHIEQRAAETGTAELGAGELSAGAEVVTAAPPQSTHEPVSPAAGTAATGDLRQSPVADSLQTQDSIACLQRTLSTSIVRVLRSGAPAALMRSSEDLMGVVTRLSAKVLSDGDAGEDTDAPLSAKCRRYCASLQQRVQELLQYAAAPSSADLVSDAPVARADADPAPSRAVTVAAESPSASAGGRSHAPDLHNLCMAIMSDSVKLLDELRSGTRPPYGEAVRWRLMRVHGAPRWPQLRWALWARTRRPPWMTAGAPFGIGQSPALARRRKRRRILRRPMRVPLPATPRARALTASPHPAAMTKCIMMIRNRTVRRFGARRCCFGNRVRSCAHLLCTAASSWPRTFQRFSAIARRDATPPSMWTCS